MTLSPNESLALLALLALMVIWLEPPRERRP
jgi:hypothetical protein